MASSRVSGVSLAAPTPLDVLAGASLLLDAPAVAAVVDVLAEVMLPSHSEASGDTAGIPVSAAAAARWRARSCSGRS
jgi:hypothetical protein